MRERGLVTVYYSDDCLRAGHAFDTARKAGWVADSLRDRPVLGVVIEAPAHFEEAGGRA